MLYDELTGQETSLLRRSLPRSSLRLNPPSPASSASILISGPTFRPVLQGMRQRTRSPAS